MGKRRIRGPTVRRGIKKPVFFLTALAILIMTGANPGYSAQEKISNLSNELLGNNEILVSANLIRWTKDEILEDLNNGIPKDLFYYILLKKRLPAWIDEEITGRTIRHTIKYDVLKKQYSVTTRTETGVSDKTFDSFDEMADLISKIERVKISIDRKLRPRHTYYTSVKGVMRASKTPFYLKYIFFFIPDLELDTPWANSAPFYALEEPE